MSAPLNIQQIIAGLLASAAQKLGFPLPATDPMQFLVDDEIRPFKIDIRHDVTATNAPVQSTGQFIVHEHAVPADTGEVIMGMFPHCWERVAIDSPSASVQLIDPNLLAGFVLFDGTKSNNQPYLVSHDYNSPTIASTPNDVDRKVVRGETFLASDAPNFMSNAFRTPLTNIYLPAKSTYRVLFSLTPESTVLTAAGGAAAIPNPYQIGDTAGAIGKRIDFAGAMVWGVRMPQQTYDRLKKARREGDMGW